MSGACAFAHVPGRINGTVLHDGFGFGVWQLDRDRDTGTARLTVHSAERASKRAEAAVAAEGRRYLRFAIPDASAVEVTVMTAP